jgi:Tol biopolymer transport system component
MFIRKSLIIIYWLTLIGLLAACTPAMQEPTEVTPQPADTVVPSDMPPTEIELTAAANPTPTEEQLTVESVSHIYLAQLNGDYLEQIAPGTNPRFSNDGQYLSFAQIAESQTTLVRYDLATGLSVSMPINGKLRDYAWVPDSGSVVVLVNHGEQYNLYLIDREFSEMIEIASEVLIDNVEWSPDAHAIVWTAMDESLAPSYTLLEEGKELLNTRLVMFDMEEQRQSTILDWQGAICSLAWSPDSTQIAFIASKQNTCYLSTADAGKIESTVQRISIEGGEPNQLSLDVGIAESLEWSPDDRLIAYLVQDNNYNTTLHFIDPNDGETVSVNHVFESYRFCWSPDGQLVAVGGPGHLQLIDTTTFSSTLLRDPGGSSTFIPEEWSPDGSKLLVYGYGLLYMRTFTVEDIAHPEMEYDIYNELRDSLFMAMNPTWSPDGNWIAFSGYDDRDRYP